jgi:hypothetical protein
VKEQAEFIKECFSGDVDYLVGQWIEGKVLESYLTETLFYYEDIMAFADYYDGVLSLKRYCQAHLSLDPLLKSIDQLGYTFLSKHDDSITHAFELSHEMGCFDIQNVCPNAIKQSEKEKSKPKSNHDF